MGADAVDRQPCPTTLRTSAVNDGSCPRHIALQHWLELTEGSGISPAIAAANFRSFGDGFADPEAERRALLAEKYAALNPQPGHSFVGRMRLQASHPHLDHGGWRFLGDVLPGHSPTPRWKPNQPYTDSRGRKVKYQAQSGRRPGLLLPQVPVPVWRQIAGRYGLDLPVDRSSGFWAWALEQRQISVTVVEGEKKACALLGLGIVAVGLAGKDLGRQILKDEGGSKTGERLIPELELLATGGRQITVCFDADPKVDTARSVGRSALRLGHALAKAGANVRIAALELLEGEKCGPDDLLVAKGADALLEALAAAGGLAEQGWRQRRRDERRISPTILLAQAEVPVGLVMPDASIIGIRAPKGAGKTRLLEQWLADQPMVLSLTHRISLGAALSSRLGLVWCKTIDTGAGRSFNADGDCWEGLPPRYSLCFDSLLSIRPEVFAGATLVLDEAEQGLAHLLLSATCREHRGLLIQRLQQIIRAASRIICLDADLSDTTLRWVEKARQDRRHDIALIEASATTASPWPVQWFDHSRPDEAQAALLEAASKAPVFVTTDSKERAAALHGLLEHHLPGAAGLLISSDTTDKPEMKEWLAKLTSLDALAAGGIRWVVASPSISSGLSIEHSHFRSVFGFYGAGSMDDGEALQALARVRQAVPRSVWVQKVVKPAKAPLSRCWYASGALCDLRRKWDGQAILLRQELQFDLLMEASPIEAAERAADACALWAELQSRRNYSISHLKAFIKARLKAEGHSISEAGGELPESERAELQAIKDQLRGERREARAIAITQAPVITEAEANRLRQLGQQTPAQHRRLICQRLALPPEQLTPELVTWAEKWAGAAERFAVLMEPGMAAALDLQRLKATTPKGEAPLPFDQTYRAQRLFIAEHLGLKAFITSFVMKGRHWNYLTPEVQEIAAAARRHRNEIALGIGITITPAPKLQPDQPDTTVTRVVGDLLLSYGITTASTRIGKGPRSYRADASQLHTLRATANRLRQKHSGLAPYPPVLGASLNKTAGCGATQEKPLPAPASCEQLALSVTSGTHYTAQREGASGPSREAAQGRHRTPHTPRISGGASAGAIPIRH
jgi:hypothetical protein